MKPAVYFSVRFDKRSRDGQSRNVRMGMFWRVLHAICANRSIAFAMGFPEYQLVDNVLGRTLRVYFESREQAQEVAEALDASGKFPDVVIEFIRTISEAEKSGPQAVYFMRRIPGKPSVKPGQEGYEEAASRQERHRRRARTLQAGLPYLFMRSSQGHEFRLVVERVDVEQPAEGTPNGYGLSRRSSVVTVPI